MVSVVNQPAKVPVILVTVLIPQRPAEPVRWLRLELTLETTVRIRVHQAAAPAVPVTAQAVVSRTRTARTVLRRFVQAEMHRGLQRALEEAV